MIYDSLKNACNVILWDRLVPTNKNLPLEFLETISLVRGEMVQLWWIVSLYVEGLHVTWIRVDLVYWSNDQLKHEN